VTTPERIDLQIAIDMGLEESILSVYLVIQQLFLDGSPLGTMMSKG